MNSVEVLLVLKNRARVAEDGVETSSARLGNHVRITIDPQTCDAAFTQQFEKNSGPAAEIEDSRTLSERFRVGMMPLLEVVVLLGRTMEERKPLPSGRQRPEIGVAQET